MWLSYDSKGGEVWCFKVCPLEALLVIHLNHLQKLLLERQQLSSDSPQWQPSLGGGGRWTDLGDLGGGGGAGGLWSDGLGAQQNSDIPFCQAVHGLLERHLQVLQKNLKLIQVNTLLCVGVIVMHYIRLHIEAHLEGELGIEPPAAMARRSTCYHQLLSTNAFWFKSKYSIHWLSG